MRFSDLRCEGVDCEGWRCCYAWMQWIMCFIEDMRQAFENSSKYWSYDWKFEIRKIWGKDQKFQKLLGLGSKISENFEAKTTKFSFSSLFLCHSASTHFKMNSLELSGINCSWTWKLIIFLSIITIFPHNLNNVQSCYHATRSNYHECHNEQHEWTDFIIFLINFNWFENKLVLNYETFLIKILEIAKNCEKKL
jgi:hypothetical protein